MFLEQLVGQILTQCLDIGSGHAADYGSDASEHAPEDSSAD